MRSLTAGQADIGHRSYLPTGELHKAREYNELPDFDPEAHSLFKIHTHVTPQGFIFVNFDARETPAVSFEEQFGDDFEPIPTSPTGKEVGNEFALFPNDGWEYDHNWNSSVVGTEFNWKTFVDGFQVCQCRDPHALWHRFLLRGHLSNHFGYYRSAIIVRPDIQPPYPKILL